MATNRERIQKLEVEISKLKKALSITAITCLFMVVFILLTSCVNTEKMIKEHNWPEHEVELIRDGKIKPGFTKDQVKAAWGKPTDINVTVTESYRQEQWVYGNQYVYFKDGVVTDIQSF